MGAICAIGLQFIFTVLGIALGASSGEVTTGIDGAAVRTVGMVAGLWWLVTGTIALAVGGFVFGRLAGLPRSMPLMLEAAALWSVVALFGFMVVWSGAGMLSQAASPIGAMSASSLDPYAPQSARASMTGDRSAASTSSTSSAASSPTTARSTDSSNSTNTALAEEARRATRTASWWSVIGLLIGLAACMGGASAAVPAMRDTARTV